MPLLDHFRPPLSDYVRLESFLFTWTTSLTDLIYKVAPPQFFANEIISARGQPQIDIEDSTPDDGPVAEAARQAVWKPSPPDQAFSAVIPDNFEVQVLLKDGGSPLMCVLLLASPGNKQLPEYRKAFATKVAAYLQIGVGVCLIDIVANADGNLHNEALRLMAGSRERPPIGEAACYAASYRPVRRDGRTEVECWCEGFRVGERLPTMPLRLAADVFIPIDFEETYMDVCRRRRILSMMQ